MTDRCRQERTAALRRLIEDAEASGVSECSAEEVLAEAQAVSDELRREAGSTAAVRRGARPPSFSILMQED